MSVVLSDLSFSVPNGRVLLSGLGASFGPGRTGLIGANGSGKSTLLRLIAGSLRPTSGSVTVTGDVGYLPQDLTLEVGAPVASLLGIAAVRDAIGAIEAGDARPELFDAVGDDWDVPDRALAWLSRLGLSHVGLDDRVGRLSGGEAGRSRGVALERVAAAQGRLAEAEEAVRDDDTIRLELPGTAVAAGLTVLTVRGLDGPWLPWRPPEPLAGDDREPAGELGELIVRGRERVALTGPNGAGKTTLLRFIAGEIDGLAVRRNGAFGYLPQRLDVLDESMSVVENVRAVAPAASVNEVRAGLARFLFRGPRADQPASTLSGGERFRAVLAALLLAQPPPQLLLLDEPTNNLDMASVRQLSQALSCYQGALVVASHDVPFLRSIGITRWLRLSRAARLTDTDPQ
jgi:ATPase subunit of ABC transporter with duplicated ATPase domains